MNAGFKLELFIAVSKLKLSKEFKYYQILRKRKKMGKIKQKMGRDLSLFQVKFQRQEIGLNSFMCIELLRKSFCHNLFHTKIGAEVPDLRNDCVPQLSSVY